MPGSGIYPVSPETMNKSDATPVPQPATKELVVQNKMGIHARPAAMIVRITNKFKAEVFVENKDEQVNGKSIMGLMMLAAAKGECIKIITDGADADQAMAALGSLVNNGFGDVE